MNPAFSYTYIGAANSADADSILASTGSVGWLNLLPESNEDEFPHSFLVARGLAVKTVPVVAPQGLTLTLAQSVLSVIRDFPLGSLVLQCASGNRASAVLAIIVGEGMGWEPSAVFDWSAQEKLPYLGTQPLRNWVTASLRALPPRQEMGGAAGIPVPLPLALPLCGNSFLLKQLFHRESSTYTYLLGDVVRREAVLIDPVLECAERDLTLLRELGMNLTLVLNTHVHADHVSAAFRLRGFIPGLRSAVGKASGALADVCLSHNQVIEFGRRHLRALATPGHTQGCMSFV